MVCLFFFHILHGKKSAVKRASKKYFVEKLFSSAINLFSPEACITRFMAIINTNLFVTICHFHPGLIIFIRNLSLMQNPITAWICSITSFKYQIWMIMSDINTLRYIGNCKNTGPQCQLFFFVTHAVKKSTKKLAPTCFLNLQLNVSS